MLHSSPRCVCVITSPSASMTGRVTTGPSAEQWSASVRTIIQRQIVFSVVDILHTGTISQNQLSAAETIRTVGYTQSYPVGERQCNSFARICRKRFSATQVGSVRCDTKLAAPVCSNIHLTTCPRTHRHQASVFWLASRLGLEQRRFWLHASHPLADPNGSPAAVCLRAVCMEQDSRLPTLDVDRVQRGHPEAYDRHSTYSLGSPVSPQIAPRRRRHWWQGSRLARKNLVEAAGLLAAFRAAAQVPYLHWRRWHGRWQCHISQPSPQRHEAATR